MLRLTINFKVPYVWYMCLTRSCAKQNCFYCLYVWELVEYIFRKLMVKLLLWVKWRLVFFPFSFTRADGNSFMERSRSLGHTFIYIHRLFCVPFELGLCGCFGYIQALCTLPQGSPFLLEQHHLNVITSSAIYRLPSDTINISSARASLCRELQETLTVTVHIRPYLFQGIDPWPWLLYMLYRKHLSSRF